EARGQEYTCILITCIQTSRFFFFSSRRRHTSSYGDWSSDVCSSDLVERRVAVVHQLKQRPAGPGRIQIVIERGTKVRLELRGELRQLSVSFPVSRFPFHALVELSEPLDARPRAHERLVGEVERFPIVRLPEQQRHRRGVHALLAQITRGEKIS